VSDYVPLRFLVTDIDHTLADAAWRDPLLGKWEEYYLAGARDKVVPFVAEIVRHFHLGGTPVVAVTARPEKWRCQTVNWLYRHELPIDEIHMRGDDDHRPGCIVKPELIRQRFADLSQVVAVLEDRDDCVAEYRKMGLNVLQVVWRGANNIEWVY